jgi:hypothetical protein
MVMPGPQFVLLGESTFDGFPDLVVVHRLRLPVRLARPAGTDPNRGRDVPGTVTDS